MASNDMEAMEARAEKDAHLEFLEKKATFIKLTIDSLEQHLNENRKTLQKGGGRFLDWITSAMNHAFSEFQSLQDENKKSLSDDLTTLSAIMQQLQKGTSNEESIKNLMAEVEALDIEKKARDSLSPMIGISAAFWETLLRMPPEDIFSITGVRMEAGDQTLLQKAEDMISAVGNEQNEEEIREFLQSDANATVPRWAVLPTGDTSVTILSPRRNYKDLDESEMRVVAETTVLPPVAEANEPSDRSPLKSRPLQIPEVMASPQVRHVFAPLEEPSPVQPRHGPVSTLVADVAGRRCFTPSESSTCLNVEERLRNVHPIPANFDLQEQSNADLSVLETADGAVSLIGQIQSHLAKVGHFDHLEPAKDMASRTVGFADPAADEYSRSAVYDKSLNASDSPTSKKARLSTLDLSKKRTIFACIKTVPMQGLPQSVSADPNSNLVLVTDIARNKIFKFSGIEPDGEWKPPGVQFLVPRYVLCIPEDRVVVLDNTALYVFKNNGKLLTRLLSGEAHLFRGLAYCKENNTIISTMSNKHLVFIDIEGGNQSLEDRIDLPCDDSFSKVRYVAYRDGIVYTTDMGLGQLYITGIRDRTTTVHKPRANEQNVLQQALGVDVDSAGNVLISSFDKGKVVLLGPNGDFLRNLSLPEVTGPCGVAIATDNDFVYVVDSQSKQLCIYKATQIESFE